MWAASPRTRGRKRADNARGVAIYQTTTTLTTAAGLISKRVPSWLRIEGIPDGVYQSEGVDAWPKSVRAAALVQPVGGGPCFWPFLDPRWSLILQHLGNRSNERLICLSSSGKSKSPALGCRLAHSRSCTAPYRCGARDSGALAAAATSQYLVFGSRSSLHGDMDVDQASKFSCGRP
ncbi:hypothetical protein CEP53_012068 [Fusarium sp. AF-6]|nr:hypothetical protein CEP53_012068 [Fusarium sp. AF-6]